MADEKTIPKTKSPKIGHAGRNRVKCPDVRDIGGSQMSTGTTANVNDACLDVSNYVPVKTGFPNSPKSFKTVATADIDRINIQITGSVRQCVVKNVNVFEGKTKFAQTEVIFSTLNGIR